MTTYSIQAPDGKTYSINGPAGATRDQVIAKIKEQYPNLGFKNPHNLPIGPEVGDVLSPPSQPKQPISLGQEAVGAGEAGLSALSGMTTGVAGTIYGVLKQAANEIRSGKYGSSEAADRIEQEANKYSQALTYSPSTPAGQRDIQALGEVANLATPIAPMLGELRPISEAASYAKHYVPVPIQNVSEAISTGINAPIKAIKRPVNYVTQAITNRLPGGTNRAITSVLNDISGKYKQAIIDKLKNAPRGETAPQAALGAGSHEFSALQSLAAKREPSIFADLGEIDTSQQAARLQSIKDVIAKNEGALSAAKKSRKIVTEPHYTAAEASQISVNPTPVLDVINETIKKNINENSITRPLLSIKRKLESDGQLETNPNNLISLSNHIRDMLNKTVDGKNIYNTKVLTNIKTQLDDLISQKVPDYGVAKSTYAEMSAPINQMKIGQYLYDVLKPRMGSEERATPFANAIANADKIVKNETGMNKPMSTVLNAKQMDVVQSVMDQLNRDKDLAKQASTGKSNLAKIIGDNEKNLQAPAYVSRVTSTLNYILKRVEGLNTEKALSRLTELMKPENRDQLIKLLEKAKPQERKVLMLDPAIAALLAGTQENK